MRPELAHNLHLAPVQSLLAVRVGWVYAFDQETGCTRWQYQASSEVRNGLTLEPWDTADEAADPLLFLVTSRVTSMRSLRSPASYAGRNVSMTTARPR